MDVRAGKWKGRSIHHGKNRTDKIYYTGYFEIFRYRIFSKTGSEIYGEKSGNVRRRDWIFYTLILTVFPTLFGGSENYRIYNGIVTAVLFVTVLFANFAESVAEGRGKAQAASLKKTKKDTKARILLADGEEKMINASELKKGDVVLVKMGEVIPNDGEVIEGIASVDESAITGESAPVTRESGGDFSSVTGGTTVVSDWLKIKITSEPGNSFLDRMIALVEGASRKKTPNEIALSTLLVH